MGDDGRAEKGKVEGEEESTWVEERGKTRDRKRPRAVCTSRRRSVFALP